MGDDDLSETAGSETAGESSTSENGASEPAGGLASWTPGEHDLIPLLPRGTALFEGLPAKAVVIEALSPAIGHGAVVVRRTASVGVILIKDGALFEEYAFEGGARLEGGRALQVMAGWDDATVAAYRFDPLVIAVAPALFRGAPCYADLRLEWTDWKGLLTDLCSRDGSFVVELDTPLGRGVTLIVDGRQVATYTEEHPELGASTLLDPLGETRHGTIWVRREPAAVEPAEEVEAELLIEEQAAAAGQAVAAATEGLAMEDQADWPPTPTWPAAETGEEAVAAYPDLPPPPPGPPSPSRGGPFSLFSRGQPSAPQWETEAGWEPAGPAQEELSLAVLAPQLKEVARLHLQRSSLRVETMVDEAAAQGLSLDQLLTEVRSLVIRGVMQSTLDQVANDMAAVAGQGLA
ncbi:MAG TPA: hypothetical protein VEK76_07720 [Candidatus Binatia bacterium]|nr:hypothetical protein [Candidatus Binatia bacterium]